MLSSIATACVAAVAACSSDGPTSNGPSSASLDVLVSGIPEGWSSNANPPFLIGVDQTDRHGGRASLYLTATNAPPPGQTTTFISAVQSIRADAYRGKRVRWSAWVKPVQVAGATGLFMRVDGPGVIQAFDNMSNRPITGSADWHEVSVVLDVPANAIGISVGVLSSATGTLLVDDMSLTVVGTGVATTTTLSGQPLGVDSATVAQGYARDGGAPINLDFEGLPGPSSATVDWLSQHTVSLATTDPQAGLDDLSPLAAMVGSAHVVGMGEDTHGTRQFFLMKHRLLEFLVSRLGFTTFAIEATTPESDDMNRYVLAGAGDPKVLLSRLYFWTWNTQEVLDMVQWMRQWNSSAPPDRQVRFLGFDIQSPGASMDSVASFIARVDPAEASFVADRYACIAPFRNHGPTAGLSGSQYAHSPATDKAACVAGLQEVHDLIQSRSAAYQAASSPAVYQLSLHAARLVQEFEAMISPTDAGASSLARDKAMAENIEWIRDQAGPDAKVALWAHNGHINAVPQLMGGYLRAAYGSDYRPLGFAFGTGGFNAIGTVDSYARLQSWQATIVPNGSIEAAFGATQKPLFLFDTRQIPAGGAGAAPLGGPIAMRSVGAVFDPTYETAYFHPELFPNDFDLVIYVATTSPSTLLPFTF